MNELERLSKDESVETRIRIIIQNTLEKRPDGWKSKLEVEGPKTVKEIKKAYLREQEQAQYATSHTY